MANRDAHRPIWLPELARELHLPIEWLRDAAEKGLIPSLSINKERLFNRAAVEAALYELAAHSEVPTKED